MPYRVREVRTEEGARNTRKGQPLEAIVFWELHERLAVEAAWLHYRSEGRVAMDTAIEQVARRNVPPNDQARVHDMKVMMGRVLGRRSAAKRREQEVRATALLRTPPDYRNEQHRRVIDRADAIRVWILGKEPGTTDAFFSAVALVAREQGLPYRTQMGRIQSWFGTGFAQKRGQREQERRAASATWEAATPTLSPRRYRQLSVRQRPEMLFGLPALEPIDPHSDEAAALFNRVQEQMRKDEIAAA